MSVSASWGGFALLSTCACVHANTLPVWPDPSGLEEYTQVPQQASYWPYTWDPHRDGPSQSPYPHTPVGLVYSSLRPGGVTEPTPLVSARGRKLQAPDVSFNASGAPQRAGAYLTYYSEGSARGHRGRKQSQVGSGVELDISHLNSSSYSTTWAPELDSKPGRGRTLRGHHRRQIASKQARNKVSIIVGLVLIPFFSLFGSVGNIMSLRVLSRMRMRNVINLVLAALAVSDLLFLLNALFFSFLKLYRLRDPVAGGNLRAVTFPFLGAYSSVVTARITTGLTIMLSVERLVAVYFPMKARVMCSRTVTLAGILLIYLVTGLMFAPFMLKYRADRRTTLDNGTVYVVVRTSLGNDPRFFPVYGPILNTLFRFLPLALLMLVNVLIAVAIRRTWRLRQTISSSSSSYRIRGGGGAGASAAAVTNVNGSGGGGGGRGSDSGRGSVEYTRHTLRNSSYEQRRITLMLLAVSLVSLVCIMPGAIHSIMMHAWEPAYSKLGAQSNLYVIMGNVSYWLETVNSSVNFIIYMAFSAKFKTTYQRMFCCRGEDSGYRGSARSVVHFTNRAPHKSVLGERRRAGTWLGSSSSSNGECNRERYPLRQWPR